MAGVVLNSPSSIPPPPPLPLNSPPMDRTATLPQPAPPSSYGLKVKRRSSKPILAWVQRKLAGASSGNVRSVSVTQENSPELGGRGAGPSGGTGSRGARQSASTSATYPPPKDYPKKPRSNTIGATNANGEASKRRRSVHKTPPPLNLATRNSEGGGPSGVLATNTESSSLPPSPKATSVSASIAAPGSVWSPSNPLEADDDASIRPLPPTSPPSPTPSRSTHRTVSSQTSGGYLSDPRTFRSNAASTKPTTLLSVEMGGGPMAHIAQHPPSIGGGTAPSSPTLNRFSLGGASYRPVGHAHVPSTTSITFSALPNGTTQARHPLASTQVAEPVDGDGPLEAVTSTSAEHSASILRAPDLSHYHPRNNPRPSSPPLDNASMLTLASSAFGASPRHHGPPSIASRFPASVSLHGYRGSSVTGFGLDTNGYTDPAASVRALRPRSRRGSWDSRSVASTETGWSAAVHQAGRGNLGPRSMRTADDADVDGDVDDVSVKHQGDEDETSASIDPSSMDLGGDQSDVPQQTPQVIPVTLIEPTPEQSHVTTPAAEVRENPVAVAGENLSAPG